VRGACCDASNAVERGNSSIGMRKLRKREVISDCESTAPLLSLALDVPGLQALVPGPLHSTDKSRHGSRNDAVAAPKPGEHDATHTSHLSHVPNC
jgi:hypothetical protein